MEGSLRDVVRYVQRSEQNDAHRGVWRDAQRGAWKVYHCLPLFTIGFPGNHSFSG